jgi:hypothetical protein
MKPTWFFEKIQNLRIGGSLLHINVKDPKPKLVSF